MDSLVWENPLKFYTMRYFLCLLLLVVSFSAFALVDNNFTAPDTKSAIYKTQ